MAENWYTNAQWQYVRLNDAKKSTFHLYHIKDHEISVTFYQETWHQACLVFILSALKKGTAKTYFLHWHLNKSLIDSIIGVVSNGKCSNQRQIKRKNQAFFLK